MLVEDPVQTPHRSRSRDSPEMRPRTRVALLSHREILSTNAWVSADYGLRREMYARLFGYEYVKFHAAKMGQKHSQMVPPISDKQIPKGVVCEDSITAHFFLSLRPYKLR